MTASRTKFTPAHSSKNLAELVCSNSLKSGDVWGNACGLLKKEMRLLGSLVMEAADATKVPAGGALAVDREAFSAYITEKIRSDPNIEYVPEEVKELPQGYAIVATGPLTLDALAEDIRAKLGGALHFYDAAAPSSPPKASIIPKPLPPTATARARAITSTAR